MEARFIKMLARVISNRRSLLIHSNEFANDWHLVVIVERQRVPVVKSIACEALNARLGRAHELRNPCKRFFVGKPTCQLVAPLRFSSLT